MTSAPPINCPVCACKRNTIVKLTQLFPDDKGVHHATSIEGPGRFVAKDDAIPIKCDGPVVVIEFHCQKGHSWAMTMREDKKHVHCALHQTPDWQNGHPPTDAFDQQKLNSIAAKMEADLKAEKKRKKKPE